MGKRGPRTTSPDERFWAKVEFVGACWSWTAGRFNDGYGMFMLRKGTTIRAHHFLVGKPPPGLVWDHLCRNHACVCPAHLELIPPRENIQRGKLVALKTECSNGHPWVSKNLRTTPRGLLCKICARDRSQKYRLTH